MTHLDPGETDLTWDAGLVLLTPAISIEKRPDTQQITQGDTVTFTIVVRNTGELDLKNVTVSDPQTPACDRLIGDLAVGQEITYSCTTPAVLVDFTNVATVQGQDQFGREVTDENDARVDVLPVITVDKTAAPELVPTSGGVVTFTVTVFNQVNEPLTLTSLVDDVFGDLQGQGTCVLPQTLPVGGGYTCHFSAAIGPGETPHHDTVTAGAQDDEGNQTGAEDDATVVRFKPAADSAVGDFVWTDKNSDGVQDADEAPVSGVLVTLYRADGSKVGDMVTDSKGLYKFTALEAGDYYLEFAVSNASGAFTNFTLQDAGDNDLIDSDVVQGGLTGRTVVFNLPESTEDLSWDAGLLVPTAEDETDEPVRHAVFLPLLLNR